jgi:transcriptional regulator with XRE-family HTH domain
MTLGEIVARNLRWWRQKRGLTQEELAHRVGIDRNYVGMIEREENSPTIAMIERLSKALQIDPVVLLRRDRRR